MKTITTTMNTMTKNSQGPPSMGQGHPSEGNAKGTMLIGVVKSIKALPGSSAIQSGLPERLQAYFKTRILPSRWYPEQDYVALLDVLASLMQKNRQSIPDWPGDMGAWERIGLGSAQEFSNGPYRALFGRDSVLSSLQHFCSLWKLRHDTGELEVEPGADRLSATLTLCDYAVVSKNHCEIIEGSIIGFLSYTQSQECKPQVRKLQCTSRGDSCCTWRVRWSAVS